MRAGIALGSNLGNRFASLCAARNRICRLHEDSDSDLLQSSIYETEPVDCPPGTEAFLNAVLEIESSKTPEALLAETQQIERELGRPAKHAKNSPRTIDVDLLYVGDREIDTPDLQLPHPRIAQRRFVLEPLSEIRPSLKIPGESLTISDLLKKIRDVADELSLYREAW